MLTLLITGYAFTLGGFTFYNVDTQDYGRDEYQYDERTLAHPYNPGPKFVTEGGVPFVTHDAEHPRPPQPPINKGIKCIAGCYR